MSLSNSFHSSARKHAITSAGKLASVERHNDRGYYSRYYDKSKICSVIGDASTIVEDTKKYINDTFTSVVEDYNDNQKRADRRIKVTPYEHFCSNKSLDIANEVILQIGDKEFWSRWRTDTEIEIKEKKVVLKEFPENIKTVMNEIYKKQAEAYEQIYVTHGEQILELVTKDLKAANDAMAKFSKEEKEKFEDIFKREGKEQKALIEELDEPDRYISYAAAQTTIAAIKKLKLESRMRDKQMHIKLLNLTTHYDEFSPHGHGVSVCWTEDYKTGLSSRVAKSVVLNPWALTVIQDRLREIAEAEIAKHPEIFQEQELGEKKRGRNLDFSTEEITRINQQKLIDENKKLQVEVAEAKAQNEELQQTNTQLQHENQKIQEDLAEKEKQLQDVEAQNQELQDEHEYLQRSIEDKKKQFNMLKTYEEYVDESDLANESLDKGEELIQAMTEAAKPLRRSAAEVLLNVVIEKLRELKEIIEKCLMRMTFFEIEHKVEKPLSEPIEERKKGLVDKILNAEQRHQKQLQENGYQTPGKNQER